MYSSAARFGLRRSTVRYHSVVCRLHHFFGGPRSIGHVREMDVFYSTISTGTVLPPTKIPDSIDSLLTSHMSRTRDQNKNEEEQRG